MLLFVHVIMAIIISIPTGACDICVTVVISLGSVILLMPDTNHKNTVFFVILNDA